MLEQNKKTIESQIMEQLENSDNKKIKKIAKKIKKYNKEKSESILGKFSDIMTVNKKEYEYEIGFYNAFKEMLSSESREKLDLLDKKISDIESSLEWSVMPNHSLIHEDHFINQSDSEFETHDTYHIHYDPVEGYFVDEGKPYNQNFEYVKRIETSYMEKNRDILKILHEARVERHNFLNNNYELSSDNYENLAQSILSYLGEDNELVRLKSHAGLSQGYEVIEDMTIDELINLAQQNDITIKNNFETIKRELIKRLIEKLIKLSQQNDITTKNNYETIKQESIKSLIEKIKKFAPQNDITIKNNDETIKQELIKRLIEKQKKIKEQETEIQRLKSQKELTDEE